MDELMKLHQMVERLEKSVVSIRELTQDDLQVDELTTRFGQSYDLQKVAAK